MYKGKLPCIGCGKSGEEAHRQSKDCLCEDCANSLKIGRAIVKERNLESKTNKAKLNSIGDEYWWHVHNQDKTIKLLKKL